jgi:hypothetical protein
VRRRITTSRASGPGSSTAVPDRSRRSSASRAAGPVTAGGAWAPNFALALPGQETAERSGSLRSESCPTDTEGDVSH